MTNKTLDTNNTNNTLETAYLTEFFSYKRPHGSDSEWEWIDTFITPKLPEGKHFTDGAGNIHVDLRTVEGDKARTLFVAHTDTVHKDEGLQQVHILTSTTITATDSTTPPTQTLRITDPTETNCLGADDGAGVLVLLNLIAANVPAYYIFTRCEERGGLGAKHLVDNYPMLLGEFDRAIAFDRRGTSSVITHQGWGRCCSDIFADRLSDALSDDNLMYSHDDTGVYTDTAEFVDIIPECTNVSVGYDREHTVNETLDLNHLRHLINRVLSVDWEALPVERDPMVKENLYGEWSDLRHGRKGSMGRGGPVPRYTYCGDEFEVSDEDGVWHEVSDYKDYIYGCLVDAENGYNEELIWAMASAFDPEDPVAMYKSLKELEDAIDYEFVMAITRLVDESDTDSDVDAWLVEACYDLMYLGGRDV